jgi:hypothetical protein
VERRERKQAGLNRKKDKTKNKKGGKDGNIRMLALWNKAQAEHRR